MIFDSSKIFQQTGSVQEFNETTMELFRFQANHNPVYKHFIELLGINVAKIHQSDEIPFLPVELYKSQKILCESLEAEIVFESSSTTGKGVSRHYISNAEHYKQSIENAFRYFYGDPHDFIFLGLLPGYLERNTSSLVYMIQHLIQRSQNKLGGFYLHQFDDLKSAIYELAQSEKKIMLIGVTWALMDFAEYFNDALPPNVIIMETGGMKGRKKEIIREDLYTHLQNAFHITSIHSEYGMTELQSMAFSSNQGKFKCPPWMKIIITETNDPFRIIPYGETGTINIIDLANASSCAFIATSDLGRLSPDGYFEVLGRKDNSDIRGCSLLAI